MVASLTRDKELYGVMVDPLQLGPILGTNLQLSYALLGYQVTVTLKFCFLFCIHQGYL